MRLETERNIVHLALGSLIAAGVAYYGRETSFLVLSALLILGGLLQRLEKAGKKIPVIDWFLDRMERKGVSPGAGTISFFIGAWATVLLFDSYTAFVSILILAFLDSFSTIVGMAFPLHYIRKNKTLEGTLAGFLAAWIVSSLFLPYWLTFPACFTSAIVELYTPVDDNIVLPPVSAGVITLTRILF